MIFCGYASRSKGFRFWDPSLGDIILSCDAHFDEQRFGIDGVSTSSSQDDPFPTLELDSFILPSPHVSSSTPPTSTQILTTSPPSSPIVPPSPITPSLPLVASSTFLPSTSAASSSTSMKSTIPPRWVRSLLRDSDSPILPQASMGRTTRQSHNVNYALLSYISDVHEPVDTLEGALSHPF